MQEKIDVLNRNEFIDRIYNLIKIVTENKKSCSFAIDGKWGSGKSFVLEKIKDKLEMEQSEELKGDKFFVSYYDCWKYDYYDEPIISIIASLIQTIEREQNILSNDTTEKIWQKTKDVLEGIVCSIAKNKYGVDIDILMQKFSKPFEMERKYDKYFGFPEVLRKIRECIQDIAKNKPVVIIVDELDRCLPTYAIHVLERLHHVFEKLNNVVVIIAMDKSQMSESLKTIYGANLDVNMYLKKFISFTLQLDNGKASGFLEKYKEYAALFEVKSEDRELIEEFLADITYEIDIRTQEKIFEKAETMHQLLLDEGQMDASILLFEILILCSWEKCKGNVTGWLLNGSHNVTIEKMVGPEYYKTIKLYRDKYVTSGQRVIWNNKQYTEIENKIIGRCFFLVAKINSQYESGVHENFRMAIDLKTEVDFAGKIFNLFAMQ